MPERFSASNAAKHMACHASANLEKAIPNYEEPVPDDVVRASDVGTEAHSVFEKLMGYSPSDLRHWFRVLEYVEKLRSTRRFKVERELTLEAIWLPVDPQTGKHPQTTLDLLLYTQDEMHMLDLKWGKVPVPVFDNDQLFYYTVTAAAHGYAPKAKGATFHILQPRADNMDHQYVTAAELDAWKAKAITTQTAIHGGSLAFGPSDHCKFCPAYPHSRGVKGAPLCPATMKLLYPTPFDEDEILGLS